VEKLVTMMITKTKYPYIMPLYTFVKVSVDRKASIGTVHSPSPITGLLVAPVGDMWELFDDMAWLIEVPDGNSDSGDVRSE
jgi:hypothetical protein